MKHIRNLALLLAFTLLLSAPAQAVVYPGSPQMQYDDASQAMFEGRYGEAAALYESLMGYSDAAQMSIYCRALELAGTRDWDTAVLALESLGSFKDAPQMAAYFRANQLEEKARAIPLSTLTAMNAGGVLSLWRDAIAAYEPIRFYRSAATRMADMITIANDLETRLKSALITVRADDSGRLFGDRFTVQIDGKWGVMNLRGELVEECRWTSIGSLDGDRIVVSDGNGYGIVNQQFETLLACQWGSIGSLNGELIPITDKNNRYGLMDQQYKVVLPCEWRKVEVVPGADWARVSSSSSYRSNWGAAELHTGKTLVRPSYAKLEPLGSTLLRTGTTGSSSWTYLYGAVDRTGKTILQNEWDSVELLNPKDNSLTGTFLLVRKNKLQGLFSAEGKELIPARFTQITAKGSMLQVRSGSSSAEYRYGLYTPTGEVLIPCEMKSITTAGENFICCSVDNRYGLISGQGQQLIPMQWDGMTASDNLLIVKQDGAYGLIAPDGRAITPVQWQRIKPMGNGRYTVQRSGLVGVINDAGVMLIPCTYSSITATPDELGHYPCSARHGQHGSLNAQLELAVPCEHPSAVRFNSEGVALIEDETNMRMYLIDQTGKMLLNGTWQTKDLTLTLQGGLWGLQKDGQMLIPCRYDAIPTANEPWALVIRGGLVGVADMTTGQETVSCAWDGAMFRHDTLAVVRTQDLYGLVDMTTGRIVSACQWEDVLQIVDGYACVRLNGAYGVLCLADQRLVIPCEWERLELYPGWALVQRDRRFGAVSTATGQIIQQPVWESHMQGSTSRGGAVDLVQFRNAETVCLVYMPTGTVVPASQLMTSAQGGDTLLMLGEDDTLGLMAPNGAILSECIWQDPEYVYNNPDLFIVSDGDGTGLLSAKTGKLVTPCDYDEIHSDEYSTVIIGEKDDLYCLISPEGKALTACIYDRFQVSDNLCIFRRTTDNGRRSIILNSKGENLLGHEFDPDDLTQVAYQDGILLVHMDDKLQLYTTGLLYPEEK